MGKAVYISQFLKYFVSLNFYLSPITKQDILCSLLTRGQRTSVHCILLFLRGSLALLTGRSYQNR